MKKERIAPYHHSRQTPPFMIRLLLFSLLFLPAGPSTQLFAQQHDTLRVGTEREFERILEEFDSEGETENLEEILEFLQHLAEHPVNVNRAPLDDLMQVPGFNLRLAQNIIDHRTTSGPFLRVEDLLQVQGIGPVTLERAAPFLTSADRTDRTYALFLNPRYWTENSRFEGFSRFQRVLEEQRGYTRPDTLGGFTGSPVKYYQRFRYRSNHLSVNLTQDKDPGEPLAHPADFDYNSWHIALLDNGRLQRLILGDFSVSFGQGLLLWSGGVFGKGSDVIRTPNKNERGIQPYTSAMEMSGFRGIAATYGTRVQVTGFYSNRRRTATELDDTQVRYPTESGLHRTLNERQRRLNLRQETAGGRIRFQLPNGFAGFSGFYNRFDRPVVSGTLPWQIHNFEGKVRHGYAADYRFTAGPALFFGEAAWTDNHAYGLLSGVEAELGPNTDVVGVYRYYAPDFQALFGAGFGEQSGIPSNEEGFYIGIRQRFSSSFRLNAYIDQFRFPAARFLTRQPSSGYDWLALLEYQPTRTFRIYTQARFKEREEEFVTTDELDREIRRLGTYKRGSFRIQGEVQATPRLRFRTRFDSVRARAAGSSPSRGYLAFQDLQYRFSQQLRMDTRITLFRTDSYDSRLFQFENDLLYVLSNTMLFDHGHRMYILFHYRASDRLDFWMKAATTAYSNRDVISSGNLQIDGNRRSDIGIQARLRF
jgi:competence ComEA-like helix-hairpin-helix protein